GPAVQSRDGRQRRGARCATRARTASDAACGDDDQGRVRARRRRRMGAAAREFSRAVAEARRLTGVTEGQPAKPPCERSTLLDAEGLVAAAALLADHGKRGLQRVEVGDLGVADSFRKACDMLAEAGLVFPDFCRDLIIALGLHALDR